MTFRTPIFPVAAHQARKVQGRWIEMTYAASLLYPAARPRLVTRDGGGVLKTALLPAPVLGRAVWAGRIENSVAEAWLESPHELRLERLEIRSLAWCLARSAQRRPLHAAAALALAAMGRTDRAARRVSRALTEAPLPDYARWAARRRRAYEADGLDAPPPGLSRASIEVTLGPGETLLPHAMGAVALAFAADPALTALQGDSEIVVGGRPQAGFASAWTPARGAIFYRTGTQGDASAACRPAPFRNVLTRQPARESPAEEAEPDLARWPHVSIVVPTRDRLDLLKACVDSVLSRTDYPSFDLTIADNESVEPATLAYLDEASRRVSRLSVIRQPGAFNFSRICNAAAAASGGEALVFLNNDVEAIGPSWLKDLVRQAVKDGTGAVGPTLVYPDGRIQHAGVALGLGGTAGHVMAGRPISALEGLTGVRRVTAVTGACLAVMRAKFEAAGGFDESFPVAYSDIDLCLRLADQGWQSAWLPRTHMIHRESATRGRGRDDGGAAARFASRWADAIADDRNFHPAFSLAALDLTLA